jgi:hypothetical protein
MNIPFCLFTSEGEYERAVNSLQFDRLAPDDNGKVTFQTTQVVSLAAREVSQRGGGARRGSEAPELMSPQGEIQAQRA